MNRTGRVLAGVALVAVGLAGVGAGLAGHRPTSVSSPYLTEAVARGTVQKTISDSGTVVDEYTYTISPGADPVLTARDGIEVGQAARGAQGYTTRSLQVRAGDSVDEGDSLATVRDADDDDSTIEAPYAGRVRSVTTADGAAASTLITLGSGRQEIALDVSEYDVTRLRADQNVELRLDGDGTGFDGTIARISPTARTVSGVQTYRVVVRTAELPRAARLGMTVTASITVSSRAGVLTVPLTALQGKDGDRTVRVVDDRGRATSRTVSVGLVGDSRAEITTGLQAGEQVVTGSSGEAATTAGSGTPAGGFPGAR